MSWMEWAAIYVAGVILFNVWEAYVGFGFKFPRFDDGPNAACASVFWPIGLPICLLILFCLKLEGVKERRLEKERTRDRVRVAAEQERDTILEQIEKEMSHVEAEDQNTTRYAKIIGTSSSSYTGRRE